MNGDLIMCMFPIGVVGLIITLIIMTKIFPDMWDD